MTINTRFCRVCGFEDNDEPYGHNGDLPSFEYCPCCGVQHGYEDCLPEAAAAYRKNWLATGATFEMPKFRPASWNLAAQLRNIPLGFM
ncbi:hypothetical protein [Hymenobacter lucidus]|uniref:Rubredoxin-like domain-containing protein n=1 Tax=Hymenobacter lucidus TaxID=2880930 RepID=A0ABS8AXL0_9BACT|nr:hypothetical protein [Hymenobacter lucidus]MCB2410565.1 hypothetical protein [Hymenobacter lucidus]